MAVTVFYSGSFIWEIIKELILAFSLLKFKIKIKCFKSPLSSNLIIMLNLIDYYSSRSTNFTAKLNLSQRAVLYSRLGFFD